MVLEIVMRSLVSRVMTHALLVVVAWLLLAGATTGGDSVKQPDKLIILSTTDVKGKTSPCG
jgi:hypothetical protein